MKKANVMTSAVFLIFAVINFVRLLYVLVVKDISAVWVATMVADVALGGWCIYDILKDRKDDNDGNKSKSGK